MAAFHVAVLYFCNGMAVQEWLVELNTVCAHRPSSAVRLATLTNTHRPLHAAGYCRINATDACRNADVVQIPEKALFCKPIPCIPSKNPLSENEGNEFSQIGIYISRYINNDYYCNYDYYYDYNYNYNYDYDYDYD